MQKQARNLQQPKSDKTPVNAEIPKAIIIPILAKALSTIRRVLFFMQEPCSQLKEKSS